MAEQQSLVIRLKRLEGLIDTTDVTEWENKFLQSLVPLALERAKIGQVVGFTDKQLEVLNQVHDRHFA